MAIYFRSKDKKARAIFKHMELSRRQFQFLMRNHSIAVLGKQRLCFRYSRTLGKVLRFSVRARNRCVATDRAGSVFRYFRLSRIMLKELASQGSLTGVRKSS